MYIDLAFVKEVLRVILLVVSVFCLGSGWKLYSMKRIDHAAFWSAQAIYLELVRLML